MFRKITIEVTGGEARDLVVRLMRAVSEAIRMILEGDTGVSRLGMLPDEQIKVKLIEFDPCTSLEEVRTKWDHLTPENIPEGEEQYCHAGKDGECNWDLCPQERDGEPKCSGRFCPFDKESEEA